MAMQLGSQTKLAVVLSGGGLRSAAQIGVLAVMEDYGLRPKCIVGTSGGAIVAALYASGLRPGEIAELYQSIIGQERKLIDPALGGLWQTLVSLDLSKLKGLIKGESLRTYLHKELRYVKQFRDFGTLPPEQRAKVIQLFLTAVDINDGTEIVFCAPDQSRASYSEGFSEFRLRSDISIADAVRASIGIPGVFEPFASGGTHYVDGGLRDNLPLTVAIKLGCADAVLGVDLGYAGLRQRELVNNGVVDILSQSIDIMSMDQLAADLQDRSLSQVPMVILNPMIYDVGLLDTEYIPEMISRGRLLAETFFNSKGLDRRNSPADNYRLLFSGVTAPILYPTKDSPVYALFRKQLTEIRPKPQPQTGLAQRLAGFFQNIKERLIFSAGLILAAVGIFMVWADPFLVQGLGIIITIIGLAGIYLTSGRRGRNRETIR